MPRYSRHSDPAARYYGENCNVYGERWNSETHRYEPGEKRQFGHGGGSSQHSSTQATHGKPQTVWQKNNELRKRMEERRRAIQDGTYQGKDQDRFIVFQGQTVREPLWMTVAREMHGPKRPGARSTLPWENQALNARGQGGVGRHGAPKQKVPWILRKLGF